VKTVFFDFDGTLTKGCLPTWIMLNQIMKRNGAKVTGELYEMFMNGEIDYKEWCDLTIAKFKTYNITINDFNEVVANTKLIAGVKETFQKLKENGWHIHILSGGISQVIRLALGDALQFVDNISANEIYFKEDGSLDKIVATKYDYKGKAEYVEEYMNATNSLKTECVFVGNGANDEFVSSTGIHTICFNPDDTDPNNKEVWAHAFENSDNLQDTLPTILRIGENQEEKII